MLRVAVASMEGVAINEHFGHAKKFYIYEIEDGVCSLLAQREVRHYCLGGHSDRSAMQGILDAISDCESVFVSKIGDGPAEKLNAIGIPAVTEFAWEEIKPALLEYARRQRAAQA